MLFPSTINEHSVKDSFHSPSKIVLPSLFARILDVKSVFTYTPLEETIGTCVNSHFKVSTHLKILIKTTLGKTQARRKKIVSFILVKIYVNQLMEWLGDHLWAITFRQCISSVS